MAISTPEFNVEALSPAQLLAGEEKQRQLDFNELMKFMQLASMRETSTIAATGGATLVSDSPIMDALLGDTA